MSTELTFAQQADLLVRADQGDREALAQLFVHFGPRWERWLQSRWNCSPAEAEDRVADLRATYLVTGPLVTHPYQFIARSKARLGWMVLAAQRRERVAPQDSLESMWEGAEHNAEKLACLADKRDELHRALNRLELTAALAQLDPVRADVLRRHYEHQQSITEIAKALCLPDGTVKSHLFWGRKALVKLLVA